MSTLTCTLPGGYLDAQGVVNREALLIPLGGKEEEILAGHEAMPEAVTAVLASCVTRIGTAEPVTPRIARDLLVADRQFLLMKLREVTFGNQVQGIAACPWPGCGERVDVNFSLTEVPVREMRKQALYFDTQVTSDDGAVTGVQFRLPNGGDEESLAKLVRHNEAQALSALLERCIVKIDAQEALGEDYVAALSARARSQIESEMLALAPELGLEMAARCPACERQFTLPFELADFFFGELRTNLDLLYREVHYLAFHYHWGENEILSLPREKRRAYIDILSDEIEIQSHGI